VTTLYSYCLRVDDGAAPNPFWDCCTLTICKPAIRRVAEVGDWVVGLGSVASPIGDLSGQVIYAMRISERMTMGQYDAFCRQRLQGKIPNWRSRDFRKKVGDCIYDFSRPERPTLRQSVHHEQNREVDLGGENALLSNHFYYFGNHPRRLPPELSPIVQQTQGHKSRANASHVDAFVDWIESLNCKPNKLHGEPLDKDKIIATPEAAAACSTRHLDEDRDDRIC
jgi:putative DNA base modification enzyme with NMAD domain